MASSAIDALTGLPKSWTSSLGGRGGANLLGGAGTGLASNQLGRSTPGAGAGLGGAYSPVAGAGTSPLSQITIGKGAPDYAFDILNDPAFKMLKDSLSAGGIADAAHLRGAIQQALIGFGAVPDLPQGVLENTGLDTGGIKSLADNNPFSTLARLKQQFTDQSDSAKNQLAARGILSSGETGYQLGRIGQNQAGAQYDATNSLLGNIGTLNDQYTAGRQAAAQQLAQGALAAETNAASSGAGAGGGVTATYNAATGTWVDPSGQHYDRNGNPVALPSYNAGGGLATQTGGSPGPSAPVPPPVYDPTKLTRPGIAYAD